MKTSILSKNLTKWLTYGTATTTTKLTHSILIRTFPSSLGAAVGIEQAPEERRGGDAS